VTILMLGQHLELGWYRSEFLRSHGYEVIFPEHRKEAIKAIGEGDFDVVLLSYSLSHETSQELLEFIEQTCPDCPIIAITERRWQDPHLSPAETVLVSEGPQGLLDALEKIRDGRGRDGLRRVK
jgi:CheY-like chemotaxis protein